ncbi:MAG: hypothetical protein ACR2L1_01665 [Pyrinomonadaceae bacterium]
MSKSKKELAFLRDLYISSDWTDRFTELAEKQLSLPKKGKFLYVNSGAGNHTLALREKLKSEVEMTAVSDDRELHKISQAKAAAVKADINFQLSNDVPKNKFDIVLADAMFVSPKNLAEFFTKTVEAARNSADVLFFLPTAGSFGEIFSLLWEVLFNADLAQRGGEVENLISEIPTVSDVEETAVRSGLKNIETTAKSEIFEYDTGAEFIGSPLVMEFLLPVWLDFLSEKEKKQVMKNLAKIIDSEREGLTFRFTVKAAFVSGEKI